MVGGPWAMLAERRDVTLIFTELPAGVLGRWYEDVKGIVLAPGMTQVTRRCVLAHEIGHMEAGDKPCNGPDGKRLSARQERNADVYAARLLLPSLEVMAAVLAAHPDDRAAAADELWVDEHLLNIRITLLHPAEHAVLKRLLTTKENHP